MAGHPGHWATIRFVGGGYWCRCGQWKCPFVPKPKKARR